MLFSCSVSYRAKPSEPLFRQFQGEVLRILFPRTPVNKGKNKGRSLQGPRALPEDETSLVNNDIDHQPDH
jgi:hypothetical protein